MTILYSSMEEWLNMSDHVRVELASGSVRRRQDTGTSLEKPHTSCFRKHKATRMVHLYLISHPARSHLTMTPSLVTS